MSEILGTLFKYLVALLAVSAVMLILYQALGSSKASGAISDLAQTAANIQGMYAGQNNFTSLGTVISQNPKSVVASSMIAQDGSTLTNPWGGAVIIKPDANSAMFDIGIDQVPDKACISIANSLAYLNVTINGTTLNAPADAGAVAAACTATTNTMNFVFGK